MSAPYLHRRSPPDGPDEGVDIATLALRPKGKYVTYLFYGMRGDRYVEDGSWQLEGSSTTSGAEWGSGRVVSERFKAIAFAGLGAFSLVERTHQVPPWSRSRELASCPSRTPVVEFARDIGAPRRTARGLLLYLGPSPEPEPEPDPDPDRLRSTLRSVS